MSQLSAKEVKKHHLDVLGPDLGPVFHALWNECAWLHLHWKQFDELYGTSKERVAVLNESARLFFRIIQDSLLEKILLEICALTDSPTSTGKPNLTIRRLPSLISDQTLKVEVQNLVTISINATDFARDWRNRKIAHKDLGLAIKTGASPLKNANKEKIQEAINLIGEVLRKINLFYFDSDLIFGVFGQPGGAKALLYLLRDALDARDRERELTLQGKLKRSHNSKRPL